MNKPQNCEECEIFHTCRSYYGGRGCKYSDEEARDENTEIRCNRPAHRERPGM